MSRVLVLGDKHVGKKYVVEALVGATGGKVSWRNDGEMAATTLRTKYYSALIEFHVPSSSVLDDLSPYEGVLMVWDAGRKTSWSTVEAAMEAIARQEHGLEVMLAVANRVTPGTVLDNMQDLCLEHGVEHVAIDEGRVDEPAAVGTGETKGIERIVEALQCTMWCSMEMASGHEKPAQEPVVNAASESNVNVPTQEIPGHHQDEDFEALLNEVLSIREDVNQNRMTDDERRARAAEMAMKLWSLLGEEDESSDEET
ncbi:hypothetical protein THRCLA_03700 [Thraustotheca clavata]|uniref:Uncharacterized protein n=1 Tax=Thraustotheca clavata TaxID=74557 RepID=A0A1W0A1E1_9STRA|nr:hypothetical protein THRCLA_03700 [Thraustotheca clavata]